MAILASIKNALESNGGFLHNERGFFADVAYALNKTLADLTPDTTYGSTADQLKMAAQSLGETLKAAGMAAGVTGFGQIASKIGNTTFIVPMLNGSEAALATIAIPSGSLVAGAMPGGIGIVMISATNGPGGDPSVDRGATGRGSKKSHGLLSADEAIRSIQSEIAFLKEAQGEWAKLGVRVEDIFGRAGLSGRRITDILRPLYAILRSRSKRLNPQQIGELLDAYEGVLNKGGSFREVRVLRKRMVADAMKSARQPKARPVQTGRTPAAGRGELMSIEVSDCPETVAASVRAFNQIVEEFGRRNYAGISELPKIVRRLIQHYDGIAGENNIAEALRALKVPGYHKGGHLRRAHRID